MYDYTNNTLRKFNRNPIVQSNALQNIKNNTFKKQNPDI